MTIYTIQTHQGYLLACYGLVFVVLAVLIWMPIRILRDTRHKGDHADS